MIVIVILNAVLVMRMVDIVKITTHLSKFMNIGIYTDKNGRYLAVHVKDNVIAHIYIDGNKVILKEYAYKKGHPFYATDQEDIKYLLSKLKYKRLVSVHPKYTVPICLDEILGIQDD